MTDDTLVSFTKLRLEKLQLKKIESLKNTLIRRFLARKITWYLATRQRRALLTSKLSGPVRDEVLQELLHPRKQSMNHQRKSEQFSLVARAFVCLLSPWTRKINLENYFALCPKRKIEISEMNVFNLIAKQAKNIEILTSCRPDSGLLRERATLLALCKMKNLISLELHGYIIRWQDFILVCRSLPNLQNVKLCSFDSSINKILPGELRRSLGHAAHLRSLECKKMCIRTRRAMEQHLPHLNLIVTGCNAKSSNVSDFDKCEFVGSAERTHLSRLLQDHDRNQDLHIKFPNITHFQLNCKDVGSQDKIEDCLPRFEKLENLKIIDPLFPTQLERILRIMGGKLTTLHLKQLIYRSTDDETPLSFKCVFELCPNLEKLDLETVNVIEETGTWNSYPSLKELALRRCCIDMTVILRAPNLQKLEVKAINLETNNLLADAPSTLGKLCSLKCVHIYIVLFSKGSFQVVKQVLKNMSAYLPNLTDLRFTCRDRLKKEYEYCALATRLLESPSFVSSFLRRKNNAIDLDWFVDKSLIEILSAYQ